MTPARSESNPALNVNKKAQKETNKGERQARQVQEEKAPLITGKRRPTVEDQFHSGGKERPVETQLHSGGKRRHTVDDNSQCAPKERPVADTQPQSAPKERPVATIQPHSGGKQRPTESHYQSGGKASIKLNARKPQKSRSSRANLVFPVSRVQRYLKAGRYAERIGEGAGVYLAAVIEYLVAEVLELAGNAAHDNKR